LFIGIRAFCEFVTGAAAASAVFLGIVIFYLGEGFWFSTIEGVRQEFGWKYGSDVIVAMVRQPGFIALVCLTAVVIFSFIRKRSFTVQLNSSPFLLYALTSLIIAFATVWKLGSSTNYFTEPILAQLFLIVYLTSQNGLADIPIVRRKRVQAGLVLLFAAQFLLVSEARFNLASQTARRKSAEYQQSISNDLATIGFNRPSILNLFDHRDNFIFSSQPAVNDHLLYRLLWKSEILSTEPIKNAIRDRRYDVIMVPEAIYNGLDESGRSDPGVYSSILDAMDGVYIRRHKGTGYVYLTVDPRD
jgi:hypothetical protein